jgi:hypothetical protein
VNFLLTFSRLWAHAKLREVIIFFDEFTATLFSSSPKQLRVGINQFSPLGYVIIELLLTPYVDLKLDLHIRLERLQRGFCTTSHSNYNKHAKLSQQCVGVLDSSQDSCPSNFKWLVRKKIVHQLPYPRTIANERLSKTSLSPWSIPPLPQVLCYGVDR